MNKRSFIKGILAAPLVIFGAKLFDDKQLNKIGFINANNLPVCTTHMDWQVIDLDTNTTYAAIYADDIRGFVGGYGFFYNVKNLKIKYIGSNLLYKKYS